MVSTSCHFSSSFIQCSSSSSTYDKLTKHREKTQIGFCTRRHSCSCIRSSSPSLQSNEFVRVAAVPFAASLSVLLWSNPANAGFLSGFSGLESVPGPDLPKIEFLDKFNDENQKRYAEFDAKFKDSPLLKQLLEKSKLNKEKNKQEIQDKYCLRGAEWGVGDCSAEGMTPDERDKFIAMLKEKIGDK